MPLFSVVIATFQRDEKIEATLMSVAQQCCQRFEVLVVSDGPASSQLRETVERFGPQFSLYELPERTRSQSGPNNCGWNKARGTYIAYLGHDDIWHPDHLAELLTIFQRFPETSFAVSGALMIGPAGAVDEYTWVSGVFTDEEEAPGIRHFFPPSSVAHRRNTEIPLGRWPEPMSISAPVDSHFMLTAARAGHLFYSTQRITVFKFNSALRYLSYLQPDDTEQRKALELSGNVRAVERFVTERLDLARTQGTFMLLKHPDSKKYERGEIVRGYEKIRGITTTEVAQLTESVTLPPGEEARGFDWHSVENEGPRTWRWSGPSPRPRLAIPYSSDSLASMTVHIAQCATPQIQDSLRLFLNGSELTFRTIALASGGIDLHATIGLRASRASVLEIQMCETVSPQELSSNSEDTRLLGVCFTGLDLRLLTTE